MRQRGRTKSKRRRNNNNHKITSSARERELYTEFVNHVQTEINNDANPHLEVSESWDVTAIFLRTSLLHVSICNQSLRKDITSFYPGTELNVKDNPNNEGVIYEILIPLEAIEDMERITPPSSSRGGRSVRFAPRNEPPNVVHLLIYIILLIIIVFGATLTTTREDWAAVFAFVQKT